jgi:aminoglycoside phosphotransferase (APT) family kinase protein
VSNWNSVKTISLDWMESAILNVCHKAFPDERHLQIDTLHLQEDSVTPHQDYRFLLRCDDTDFRILLRLHFGLFSIWGETDDKKACREYTVLRHVYKQGFPAPFAYSFSASCSPFGHPFVIMDPGDGERWIDFKDSFREVQENIVDSLAHEMVKLHTSVTPKHQLLQEIKLEPLFSQLWTRVGRLDRPDLNQCFENGYETIHSMKPIEPVLLHGHLDLDNVLIQHDYIRTVINWEHAAIGDPRWDIAYTSLRIQQETDRGMANRFLDAYAEKAGMQFEHIDIWQGLVALRIFAMASWIRSLDERSQKAVTGLKTRILHQENFFRERALAQFG